MDENTRRKIEETVIDVLKESNIVDATEYQVRLEAGKRLGIDLSDTKSKWLVRNVVESFLTSVVERVEKEQAVEQQVVVPKKKVDEDGNRFVCEVNF